MINCVVAMGRLTKDPVIYTKDSGSKYCCFRIACHSPLPRYINCIAWNEIAQFLSDYIGKGSLMSVEGTIQSYYKDQHNQNIVFVHFLKVFVTKEQSQKILEKEIHESIQVEILEEEMEL